MNGYIFLITVYCVLIFVNIYAICLYYYAYLKMKRTRMIRSVFILLLSFLFENVYFFIVANQVFELGDKTTHFMIHPLFWSIPKLVVLFGLSYFIYASLKPNNCYR
jgi:hypothetical protein